MAAVKKKFQKEVETKFGDVHKTEFGMRKKKHPTGDESLGSNENVRGGGGKR
jgi:hypothetical protein